MLISLTQHAAGANNPGTHADSSNAAGDTSRQPRVVRSVYEGARSVKGASHHKHLQWLMSMSAPECNKIRLGRNKTGEHGELTALTLPLGCWDHWQAGCPASRRQAVHSHSSLGRLLARAFQGAQRICMLGMTTAQMELVGIELRTGSTN